MIIKWKIDTRGPKFPGAEALTTRSEIPRIPNFRGGTKFSLSPLLHPVAYAVISETVSCARRRSAPLPAGISISRHLTRGRDPRRGERDRMYAQVLRLLLRQFHYGYEKIHLSLLQTSLSRFCRFPLCRC